MICRCSLREEYFRAPQRRAGAEAEIDDWKVIVVRSALATYGALVITTASATRR